MLQKKFGLRIEYIYHSCFTVETDENFLVFDYYKGSIQFPHNKRITVFSSHVHPDHFNPEIFSWQTQFPNTHYILSSDIQDHPQLPKNKANITFLPPYKETSKDELKIRTYGSTDVGISFLVEIAQKERIRLFHAGDLNWWHWWGEPQEDILHAEKIFKQEMSLLKDEQIDIAFFPVDPRLEHYYSLGAEYFIQTMKPQILIPMHFGNDYRAIEAFADNMKSSSTEVLKITQANQIFNL